MSARFIQKTYSKINDRLNDRPLYFRIIILIVFLLVILTLWYMLLLTPLQNKHELLASQKTQTEKIFKETQVKITKIAKETASKRASPEQQKQHADLKRQLAVINKQLKNFDRQMVPISEMIAFLKAALTREHTLRLESLTTAPPVPLTAIRQINVPGKKIPVQSTKNQLLKQSITLVFTGDYFHTLDYLKHLEGLKWRLFWEDLQYRVTKYPTGNITIKINTLGQTQAKAKAKGK